MSRRYKRYRERTWLGKLWMRARFRVPLLWNKVRRALSPKLAAEQDRLAFGRLPPLPNTTRAWLWPCEEPGFEGQWMGAWSDPHVFRGYHCCYQGTPEDVQTAIGAHYNKYVEHRGVENPDQPHCLWWLHEQRPPNWPRPAGGRHYGTKENPVTRQEASDAPGKPAP